MKFYTRDFTRGLLGSSFFFFDGPFCHRLLLYAPPPYTHTHTDATSRCKSSDGAAGHAATLCGLQDECIKYSPGHGRYRQFLKRFTSSRFSPIERASLAIASSFGLQLRFLLLALLLRFGADLLQPRLPFGLALWGPEGAPERERAKFERAPKRSDRLCYVKRPEWYMYHAGHVSA